MLVNKDFLTWLLIGWQLCCQPIRCQVWKSLLTNIRTWNLTWILLSNPQPRLSAARVLVKFSRNIPVSAPEVLRQILNEFYSLLHLVMTLTWSYHEFVLLCSHSNEDNIILRIHFPYTRARLVGQSVDMTGQLNCCGVVHGRTDRNAWKMGEMLEKIF